jgi:hypothetical protein
VESAIDKIAHRGCTPANAIAQAKLIEKRKGRRVGLADEVIKSLDRKAVEIEVGRMPPGSGPASSTST